MTQLIFGKDTELKRWVASKLPDMSAEDFGPCRAVGMASNDGKKLYAAIVYHSYSASMGVCWFTLASAYPRWASRETIHALLSVPFRQYKVRKMMALIAEDNEPSRRLAKGMGFKMEAILRHQFGPGRHGEVWSLMDTEFAAKWGSPDTFRHYSRSVRRQAAMKVAA